MGGPWVGPRASGICTRVYAGPVYWVSKYNQIIIACPCELRLLAHSIPRGRLAPVLGIYALCSMA